MDWNRLRYTCWAPLYDRMTGAAGFDAARRQSIAGLQLRPGDRVLMVGAGTGLDLDYLPSDVAMTAIDVTPAMLRRLEARAARQGRVVTAHVMDARRLAFPDASFDAVIMHLVLAVMPEPERGLREAARVVTPRGRIAVFDKFLGDEERASAVRRLLNLVMRLLFSDLNRRLGPLVSAAGLEVVRDEPVAFRGMYRAVTLLRPGAPASANESRSG